MQFRQLLRAAAVAVATLLPSTAVAASTNAASIIVVDEDAPPVIAWFEGRQVDLSKGWGPATACAVTVDGTRCFRNEAQMDRFLGFEEGSDGLSERKGFAGPTSAAR